MGNSLGDARPTRRDVLVRGGAFGAGAIFGLPGLPIAAGPAKARGVIQIFLQGGLSHIDTFDPKPDAPIDVRGEFRPIRTKLDGALFSDSMRRTAQVADRLVVIRSMTHGEAAHERGVHNMLTGYRPSPAITYPSFGSVVSHELGAREDLPAYVCVPNATDIYLGTGYLSAAFGPFSLGSEPARGDYRVRDLVPAKGVDADRLKRRRRMLAALDRSFAGSDNADAVRASGAFYDQAWRMIESKPAREAFEINREPRKLRDRYGRTVLGQRLLQARRLIESGVRYVTVLDGGYDNHQRIFPTLRRKLRDLDTGFAALIADLDSRGLLDETLVLLTTEFGRTPRVNQDRGRDHWPKAFSVVAAGGGLKRGIVVGSTTPDASEPEADAIGPGDLAATLYTQIGIDWRKKLMSPGDRPIDIVRDGRVVREILA